MEEIRKKIEKLKKMRIFFPSFLPARILKLPEQIQKSLNNFETAFFLREFH